MLKIDALYPLLAAIIANAIWGSTFMASKLVLQVCPPILATNIRFIIALITFGIISLLIKHQFQFQLMKRYFGLISMLGLVGYTGLYMFQMIGLKHMSSSQSAAIMLTAPIFVFIIEGFKEKKINVREAMFSLLALLGAIIVFLDEYYFKFVGASGFAFWLTVIASLFLGASVVLTKQLFFSKEAEKLSTFNITFYSMLVGTVGMLPFSFYEYVSNNNHSINLDLNFWICSIYLGVVASCVAFFLWNWAVKNISSIIVAVTMYLKTPVALLIGAVLLREQLSVLFYFGCSLILISLFSNQLLIYKEKK